MWLRNVRFWYHILVLFIIVIVGMQTCCHEPTHENPRWRLSPEIVKPSEHHVYEIQKAILTFSGAPQSNGQYVRHRLIMINVKNQICHPKFCNNHKPEMVTTLVSNKAFLTSQLLFMNVFFLGRQSQRTDVRPKRMKSEDQRPEMKYSGVFPVYGFRVGFSDIGRNMALQYIVPLDWVSYKTWV